MEKSSCKNGMKVIFGNTNDGEKTLGKIIKMNQKRAKIECLEERGKYQKGAIFNVPYELLKIATESVPTEECKIKIGMKFHSPYADSNPEWTVVAKEGNNWLCHIKNSYDYNGVERIFRSEDIEYELKIDQSFKNSKSNNEIYYNSLNVGDIVHYMNPFKMGFVRCEVVKENGFKTLKPIAMVGKWSDKDLPNWHKDKFVMGYYPKMIKYGHTFSPNCSNIYEYENRDCTDPTTMKPIDLTEPEKPDDFDDWVLIQKIQEEITKNKTTSEIIENVKQLLH